jgi:hypothetical protein
MRLSLNRICILGNVLESTLWPKTAPKKASGLHSHLPFLALILTCLRGQDEQRETLLQSLLTQFTQLLQYSKEAVSGLSISKLHKFVLIYTRHTSPSPWMGPLRAPVLGDGLVSLVFNQNLSVQEVSSLEL